MEELFGFDQGLKISMLSWHASDLKVHVFTKLHKPFPNRCFAYLRSTDNVNKICTLVTGAARG